LLWIFTPFANALESGTAMPLSVVCLNRLTNMVGAGPKSRKLPYLFALTLVPLVLSLVGDTNDIRERIDRTIEAHPEIEMDGDAGLSRDGLLSALPERRIEGAHLSAGSWLHWLYALAAAAMFWGVILALFERGEATPRQLLAIGARTATVGILLLLGFQLLAGMAQGLWMRGGGLLMLVFYIIKFIGFSYEAAFDPQNGFWVSFLGFTLGVGLCEEFVKALPLYLKVRRGERLSWRAACVLGLASGVGFGVAEGIMYAGGHYNGIAKLDLYFVRFLSCVALHAIWTASVALVLWHNKKLVGGDLDWANWIVGAMKVQGVPMFLHGLYDTALKRDLNLPALVFAIASFGWLAYLLACSRASDPVAKRARFATT